MHEIGMLYQIAETVSRVAAENKIDRVKFISIDVGELSGVIPELFERTFLIVAESFPLLKDSELKINIVPGEGLCSECHALYNVLKNEGQCPRCQSRYKTVLGGKQIALNNIGY